MTKDNILVSIDATVYYRVVVPRKSVYYVDSAHSSVAHLTLATIKSMELINII
jgi:regulator of protease activity HflC (stomatin/prohibitin superfamily)